MYCCATCDSVSYLLIYYEYMCVRTPVTFVFMISINRANENRSFPRRESSPTHDTRLVHLWQRNGDDDSKMEFPPHGSAQGCPTEGV